MFNIFNIGKRISLEILYEFSIFLIEKKILIEHLNYVNNLIGNT